MLVSSGNLRVKADILSISPMSEPMAKGWYSKCQLWNFLQWPIYAINSVDNTKLPYFAFTLVLAGGRPSSYFLFLRIAFFLPPVLRLLCQESREIPMIEKNINN